MLFRDPSAWYHIVIAIDTTQSTAADRVKFYVNGELQTALDTNLPVTKLLNTYVNNTAAHSPSNRSQMATQTVLMAI